MAAETAIHPPRTMMEVFNSLPEGTHVQLIENQLIMSPAPLDIHQLYLDIIYPEISVFVRKNKLGSTRCAPYDVYLDGFNAYQPDICVILNNRLPLIKKNGLHGAPNLVIEILSPTTTARYDLNEKKTVYERNGVTEYWTVNPETRNSIGYILVNNEYREFYNGEGVLDIKGLGLKIEF